MNCTSLDEGRISTRRGMKWHVGSLIRILDNSEFNEEMAGIEMIVERGMEPPVHSHTREDEAVYVLRGEVEFTIGNMTRRSNPGEWIFLPKNVPHAFRVLSTNAHILVMYTPSGIESFYRVSSEPAEGAQIPAGTLSYDNLFDMEYINELGRQFGLKFHGAVERARCAAA